MSEIKKETFSFEFFLFVTFIVTIIAGSYESYTHRYLPAYSILGLLHSYGYLKEYAVVYAPGKGIWRFLGWTGSGMMVVMMLYSVRKRFSIFNSLGSLRHWLSAHMFLGIVGPVLVTFHTTLKFGGIIATSFWCMILTMVFGILGRYIYIQIPRTLAGAELEEGEIDNIIKSIDDKLGKYSREGVDNNFVLSQDIKNGEEGLIHSLFSMFRTDVVNLWKISKMKRVLKRDYNLPGKARKNIVSLIKRKAALIRKKNYLVNSHKLLHHWHVVHVPLAMVMFLIMFLHIIVYYLFRPVTSSVL